MALKGIRVIELAGLAPAPFCGLLLADLGASVVRVDRAGSSASLDATARGKRSIAVNIKRPEGADVIRRLADKADVIIEPFRTGVMERLGLGPSVLLESNPRLIYARLTGYGHVGELKNSAGHDINYLAVSGLLSRLGRSHENPVAPLNLVADFAGGGLTCAFGVLAALIERANTGKGQVVDANMVEGAAYLGSWVYMAMESLVRSRPRGHNLLDTGTHFYETYRTKDDRFVAVGAIEPQFYKQLINGLGLTQEQLPQFGISEGLAPDETSSQLKETLASRFLEKTRDEWAAIFHGSDACVTPVLDLDEAPHFEHNKQSRSFVRSQHRDQFEPIPAPRLSSHGDRSEVVSRPDPDVGEHTRLVLAENGFGQDEIDSLEADSVVEQAANHKAKL